MAATTLTDRTLVRLSGEDAKRPFDRGRDELLRCALLRLNAGADDYLVKPFSAQELKARIGNLAAITRSRALLQQSDGSDDNRRLDDIEETPTGCTFLLPGKDTVVRGRVEAPREAFVGWIYADPNPKGGEHHTVNCSVADLELTVEQPGRPSRNLSLPGGAAYELGMRETDHGTPIQPFGDG